MKKQIECKQCSGAMKPTKQAESNRGMQAFGCVFFIIGIVLLFVPFFPITQIIGAGLIIGGASMGYKRRKVWKCQDCGYFFERG